jgi:hypothetical protein
MYSNLLSQCIITQLDIFCSRIQMRDKRFIAIHRGGPLTKKNHRMLIRWARECSEHVLSLVTGKIDERLLNALHVAQQWENGDATVGEARNASVRVHAVARESSDPVLIALARSVGHTVATAHMADHSPGGALYALKAVRLAGLSTEKELAWQTRKLKQLPSEIVDLVITTMNGKAKVFSIFDKNF